MIRSQSNLHRYIENHDEQIDPARKTENIFTKNFFKIFFLNIFYLLSEIKIKNCYSRIGRGEFNF